MSGGSASMMNSSLKSNSKLKGKRKTIFSRTKNKFSDVFIYENQLKVSNKNKNQISESGLIILKQKLLLERRNNMKKQVLLLFLLVVILSAITISLYFWGHINKSLR
jgi:tRNA 2-selenouridine synthase SelU